MARAEDGFFDDLARGLADGSITRGKALRLMGAALVGGALGSVGIGEASADPPGCKRNGKHCTRNEQCCSGYCSGGSCQAQTTTTTTTTSTTSTSTTPGCMPLGGTCGSNGECCTGRCASDTCAEPCPSDRVLVSNGTCAIPCTSVDECPGFPSCACLNSTEGGFCAGSQSGNFCDINDPRFCDTGELCSVGVCFTAC